MALKGLFNESVIMPFIDLSICLDSLPAMSSLLVGPACAPPVEDGQTQADFGARDDGDGDGDWEWGWGRADGPWTCGLGTLASRRSGRPGRARKRRNNYLPR